MERLTRPDRQTLLFTRRGPRGQRRRGRLYNDVVTVRIGGEALRASDNVSQIVEVVDEDEKHAKLVGWLERALGEADAGGWTPRVIVFLSSKARVDAATRRLRHEGFPALSIHGDKTQEEREWVLGEFRAGKSPVMLATDVAARGLDVKDVTLVINYDFPAKMEDYVPDRGRGAGAKDGEEHVRGRGRETREEPVRFAATAGQPVPGSWCSSR